MVYNPSNMLLNSTCWPLLRTFASVFIKDTGSRFLIVSLSGFGARVMLVSQNELENIPSSPCFKKP